MGVISQTSAISNGGKSGVAYAATRTGRYIVLTRCNHGAETTNLFRNDRISVKRLARC